MQDQYNAILKEAGERSEKIVREREEHKKEIMESISAQHGETVAIAMGASCNLFEVMTSGLFAVAGMVPHTLIEKITHQFKLAHGEVHTTLLALAVSIEDFGKVMEENDIKLDPPDDAAATKTADDISKLRDALFERQVDCLNKLRTIRDETEARVLAMKKGH